MKRFWKIIAVCIVTVVVIGTFYIQAGLAAKGNAVVDFKKVSGNEEEVDHVILNADYQVGTLFQSLQITSKETLNLTNQSLIQKLTKNNSIPVLKNLIEQHRGFMRGKEVNPNYFYEDENLVAFACVKMEGSRHSAFDIALLNKKSEKTTQIQLAVPKSQTYYWIDVVEVQVIDGNLKVMARGFRSEGKSDLNVYTLNIEEQKIMKDEVIYTAPAVKNGGSDIIIINDYNSIQPEKYLLFKIEAYEDNQAPAEGEMGLDGEPKLVVNDVLVYDIEKNQSKKIVVPEEILRSISGSSAIFQSTIFISSKSASGFEVNNYDLEREKWGKKLTVDLPTIIDEENIPYIKLLNGKIYIIQATNNRHTLFIRDLKTGKSLYEGELIVKNTQKDFLFHVNEIEAVQ